MISPVARRSFLKLDRFLIRYRPLHGYFAVRRRPFSSPSFPQFRTGRSPFFPPWLFFFLKGGIEWNYDLNPPSCSQSPFFATLGAFFPGRPFFLKGINGPLRYSGSSSCFLRPSKKGPRKYFCVFFLHTIPYPRFQKPIRYFFSNILGYPSPLCVLLLSNALYFFPEARTLSQLCFFPLHDLVKPSTLLGLVLNELFSKNTSPP